MKAKRFSEEQIIGVLKEAEAGAKTKDLCRRHGISEATFYNWKAKYAGMTVSEARRLKELEQENAKLKRLLAEAELDKAALEGSATPKMVSPQAKREAVTVLMTERDFGVTRACGLVGISRSLYRYRSRRPDSAALRCAHRGDCRAQAPLRLSPGVSAACDVKAGRSTASGSIGSIAMPDWRCGGASASGLALVERKPLPKPAAANLSWSMDFVSDGLAAGRRFRCLTIVDDCTRECVAIEVDTSLTGTRVQAVLDRLAETRGLPQSITVDHGPEFEGQVLDTWAYGAKRPAIVHPTGQAERERVHRKLQRQVPRRVPERALVPDHGPCPQHHRGLAHRVQHRATTQLARQSDTAGVRRKPFGEGRRKRIFNRGL